MVVSKQVEGNNNYFYRIYMADKPDKQIVNMNACILQFQRIINKHCPDSLMSLMDLTVYIIVNYMYFICILFII